MRKKFIIVEAVEEGNHVIDVNLINTISKFDRGVRNKSEINISDGRILYSIETPKQLYQKLQDLLESKQ